YGSRRCRGALPRHLVGHGLFSRKAKRKRYRLFLSCDGNRTHNGATQRIFVQYLFKASALEVNRYIQLAREGDQQAFTYLLDKYWNEVYGFILKRVENEADAEDITIETFAKAFDKIAVYNPEYQFNTWLIAIAKNVHI